MDDTDSTSNKQIASGSPTGSQQQLAGPSTPRHNSQAPDDAGVEVVDMDSVPLESLFEFVNNLPPQYSSTWKPRITQLHRELTAAVTRQQNMLGQRELLKRQLRDANQQQQKALKDSPEVLEDQLAQARKVLTELYRRETERKQLFVDLKAERDSLQDQIDEIRSSNKEYLISSLSSQITDIKMEIVQSRAVIEGLHRDVEEREERVKQLELEIVGVEDENQKCKETLTKVSEMPARLLVQSEQVQLVINRLKEDIVELNGATEKVDGELGRAAERKQNLDETSAGQKTDFERLKLSINQSEREIEHWNKERDIVKERIQIHREERIQLDTSLKSAVMERRAVNQSLNRVGHEKDELVKLFRRAEAVYNIVKTEIAPAKERCTETNAELQSIRRECEKFKDKIGELKKEIDLLIYDYLHSEQISLKDKQHMEEVMREVNDSERRLHILVEEVREFGKAIERLTLERQMKSRDLLRFKGRLRKSEEDLKYKAFVVEDLQKTFQTLINKSKALHELYEVVKKEKNKFATLIQFAKQRILESREKAHVLQSEIEILRQQSADKSKQLTKQTQELASMTGSRNATQLDANKSTNENRKLRESIDKHLAMIELHHGKIENREQQLTQLKRDYEAALNARNSMAQQLLERNDELCVLYERQNLQEKTISSADAEMRGREEEIRRFRHELTDLRRDVGNLRKTHYLTIENQRQFDEMLLEFRELRAYEHDLLLYFHDPFNATGVYAERINLMAANDPSVEQLQRKLKTTIQEMNKANESASEKDLLLAKLEEQIKEINSGISQSRQKYLPRFEETDELIRRIARLDRELISRISELSMVQVKAMEMQQQKQELEERLNEGAVQKEVDAEWQRYQLRMSRMAKFKQTQQEKITEMMKRLGLSALGSTEPEKIDLVGKRMLFKLSDDKYTTALQRPDSYIPAISDGPAKELQIPKPYGALAPMKPLEDSAIMQKYCRPPVEKPIEY